MTVIVIDHDVAMMRSLVDRLYVLEAGDLIASGPPSILDTDRRVVEAYMGTHRDSRFAGTGAGEDRGTTGGEPR